MAQSQSNNREVANKWRGSVSAHIISHTVEGGQILVRSEFDWYVTNLADYDEVFDWEVKVKVTKRNDPGWGQHDSRTFVQSVPLAEGETKRFPNATDDHIVSFTEEAGTYDCTGYCRIEVFRPIQGGGMQNLGAVKTLPEVEYSFTVD